MQKQIADGNATREELTGEAGPSTSAATGASAHDEQLVSEDESLAGESSKGRFSIFFSENAPRGAVKRKNY